MLKKYEIVQGVHRDYCIYARVLEISVKIFGHDAFQNSGAAAGRHNNSGPDSFLMILWAAGQEDNDHQLIL